MTPFVFHRNAVGVAILSLASLAASAQQTEPAPADAAPTLKEITVTGNPLGGAELIAPTT